MSSINKKTAIEQSYELMIRCMMQAKHRLMEIGSELNLTGMQAMMLMMLEEPKPMNSFTKVFNCDASNITGIVDGLEQKSLASRFPSSSDRRIKMIRLSDKGENLRKHFIKLLIEDKESALFELNSEELLTLTALLGKIAAKAPKTPASLLSS